MPTSITKNIHPPEQRAAAMEVFDTVRRPLAEDLGVDPDRKLVEARQYVIRPDVGTTTDTVPPFMR